MNGTTQLLEPETPGMPSALVAACQCGRAGCRERFAITPRQLARARRHGGTLVSYDHLSPLDEVVGVADAFLVLAGRRRKEQSP